MSQSGAEYAPSTGEFVVQKSLSEIDLRKRGKKDEVRYYDKKASQ
jgi:hypothetical protein